MKGGDTEKTSQPLSLDLVLHRTDLAEFRSYFDHDPSLKRCEKLLSPTLHSLEKIAPDYDSQKNLLLILGKEVASSHMSDSEILSHTATVLQALEGGGGKCPPIVLDLLANSIQNQQTDFTEEDSYIDKLAVTLVKLAQSEKDFDSEHLPKASNERAIPMTETESTQVSHQILKAIIGETKSLGLSPKTSMVTTQKGGKSIEVATEFFDSELKAKYARVGHLFYIDSEFEKSIPEGIKKRIGPNLIYIPKMPNTEFGDRLGYFTLNTVASMLSVDFEEHAVLDFGSGSGVLSLTAKRLGADNVLGIELDAGEIKKANERVEANGFDRSDIGFLESDIRDTDKLGKAIKHSVKNRPVVMIINIGHWGRTYDISNIGVFSYIPLVRDLTGRMPRTIVTGGYDYQGTKVGNFERDFLKQIELTEKQLPETDKDADSYILKKLGYQMAVYSESEELFRTGSFSRVAGSAVSIIPTK